MRGGLEIRNDANLSASLHTQIGPGNSGLVLCSNFTMQLKNALQLKLKQMIKLGATMLLL